MLVMVMLILVMMLLGSIHWLGVESISSKVHLYIRTWHPWDVSHHSRNIREQIVEVGEATSAHI